MNQKTNWQNPADVYREILAMLSPDQRAMLFEKAIQAIREEKPKQADDFFQLDKLLDEYGAPLDDWCHFGQLRIRLLYDVLCVAGFCPMNKILRQANEATIPSQTKRRICSMLDRLECIESARLPA